jgi:hypothetical protein
MFEVHDVRDIIMSAYHAMNDGQFYCRECMRSNSVVVSKMSPTLKDHYVPGKNT